MTSRILIYIFFYFLGTHTYIDGTKDWKLMKKKLRFLLPHEPLKVLRGEPDECIQDVYHERFQAPGTATEEEEADDFSPGSSFTDNDDDGDDDDDEGHLNGNIDPIYQNLDNFQNDREHNGNSTAYDDVEVHAAGKNDVICSEDDALLSDDTAALLPNMQGASNC